MGRLLGIVIVVLCTASAINRCVPLSHFWNGVHGSSGVTEGTPGDCRIKGNINRKGERIYHMPGKPYYRETRIDILKGERWFCTEAEARSAGWRKSRAK